MASGHKDRCIQRVSIYSLEALDILETALERQRLLELENITKTTSGPSSVLQSRYQYSSDEGDDGERDNSHLQDEESDQATNESGSDSDSEALAKRNPIDNESTVFVDETLSTVDNNTSPISFTIGERTMPKPLSANFSVDARQRQAIIDKHLESVSCHTFTYSDTKTLLAPSCLLTKEEKFLGGMPACQSLYNLVSALLTVNGDSPFLTILSLQSGRFAGAIYRGGICIDHTTSQRYTIRKGQGKAQSTQDGSRRPKSVGAQLRRAGEQMLQEDVHRALQKWQSHIQQSALILISCPKTMLRNVFGDKGLSKQDARVRRVPIDAGRPTFETVEIIHDVVTTLTLIEQSQPQCFDIKTEYHITDMSGNQTTEQEDYQLSGSSNRNNPAQESIDSNPLTPLHIAARDGDLERLKFILKSNPAHEWMEQEAGEFLMTPLHYAAQASESGNSAAADCVYELLMNGRANPCALDIRNRVPWFLATNDKVRAAFRRARAELGEDYCEWTVGAKVAAPLTDDDIQRKKELEAEKRRKKRARQKQKKAEDKATEAVRAQSQREEAERQREIEEARRIRAGLQTKQNIARNVCDFCQTAKKGMGRSEMFHRLEFVYCSSECVQNHKRELMAAAAMKRFNA